VQTLGNSRKRRCAACAGSSQDDLSRRPDAALARGRLVAAARAGAVTRLRRPRVRARRSVGRREAEKVRYLIDLAQRKNVPTCDSLEALVELAKQAVGGGAERCGGECCVPSSLFASPAFQSWYAAQRGAGHSEMTWLEIRSLASLLEDPP
jgi:hypothetical protein